MALDSAGADAAPVVHKSQVVIVEVQEGQNLYGKFIAPATPDHTTFLILPGSPGDVAISREHLQILAAQGYGVATLNFSVHPSSVASLAAGVRPRFLDHAPTPRRFCARG